VLHVEQEKEEDEESAFKEFTEFARNNQNDTLPVRKGPLRGRLHVRF
jgi:hypothetical protein